MFSGPNVSLGNPFSYGQAIPVSVVKLQVHSPAQELGL